MEERIKCLFEKRSKSSLVALGLRYSLTYLIVSQAGNLPRGGERNWVSFLSTSARSVSLRELAYWPALLAATSAEEEAWRDRQKTRKSPSTEQHWVKNFVCNIDWLTDWLVVSRLLFRLLPCWALLDGTTVKRFLFTLFSCAEYLLNTHANTIPRVASADKETNKIKWF